MKMQVGAGEAEFEVPPVGTHKAICYRIVDAGTAEEEYQGEKKNRHQIYFFWELTEQKMGDGRPMSVMSGYTASLNEKAKLYQHVSAWLNRAFTEEEKAGFDPSVLLGTGCKVSVEHNVNGRAKVTMVHSAPNAFDDNEQLKALPTHNEQQCFELEDYCKEFSGESCEASKRMCDIFDQLPRFLQNRIAGCDEFGQAFVEPCFEMQAALKKANQSAASTPPKKASVIPQGEIISADEPPF